jgi:hypothetical protein
LRNLQNAVSFKMMGVFLSQNRLDDMPINGKYFRSTGPIFSGCLLGIIHSKFGQRLRDVSQKFLKWGHIKHQAYFSHGLVQSSLNTVDPNLWSLHSNSAYVLLLEVSLQITSVDAVQHHFRIDFIIYSRIFVLLTAFSRYKPLKETFVLFT